MKRNQEVISFLEENLCKKRLLKKKNNQVSMSNDILSYTTLVNRCTNMYENQPGLSIPATRISLKQLLPPPPPPLLLQEKEKEKEKEKEENHKHFLFFVPHKFGVSKCDCTGCEVTRLRFLDPHSFENTDDPNGDDTEFKAFIDKNIYIERKHVFCKTLGRNGVW